MWQNLGKGSDAWIFALDAMVMLAKTRMPMTLTFGASWIWLRSVWAVQKVKADEMRLTDFEAWTGNLEKAFSLYKSSAAYDNIKNIIEESVEKNKGALSFHESNSCPEFWENTRLATGLNVAVPL